MSKLNLRWQVFLGLLGVMGGAALWHAPGFFFVFTLIWIVGRNVSRLAPEDDRRFLVGLFWAGIITRLLACTIAHIVATYFGMGYPAMYAIHGQQSYDLFGDSSVVSVQAYWIANTWSGTVNPGLLDQSRIFAGWANPMLYLYAAFYYLFGFSPLALKWVSCLIGALCGVVVYHIGRTLFSQPQVARVASLLMMFFPSTFLWSLTNLKEPPSGLLLCLILLAVFRLNKKFSWPDLGLLFIWLALLWCVRQSMLPPVVLSLSVCWLYVRCVNGWKKAATTTLAIVLLLGVLRFSHFGARLTQVGKTALTRVGAQLISAHRGHALRGGSNYVIYPRWVYLPEAESGRLSKPLSLNEWACALAKGTSYFLFSPFPWCVSTVLQVATYPEMVVWYLLIPCWVRGIIIGLRYRRQEIIFTLGMLVVLTAILSLSTGNMGTGFRHRALVIPIFLLLSAIGLCGRPRTMPHAP